jgi:tripartite-type tricarboxylate transporter receptor subunit TctC
VLGDYCRRPDPLQQEMTDITAALVNQIADRSPARVYLLHFAGSADRTTSSVSTAIPARSGTTPSAASSCAASPGSPDLVGAGQLGDSHANTIHRGQTFMTIDRRRFVGASSVGALLALGLPGRGQAQPAQPLDSVKIITGFPPGGTSDTLCRRVAENLRGTAYTKSALVENKPGAGGQIAVQSMKGAPTDGSVILQTPASMLMIYPHIYKNLAYNAFTDVTAVTLGCTFDFGFCVGPAVPDSIKDIPAFLAWCKANPDKANYGSPGAGAVPHFIGVLLGKAGGVELKHVAYRGSAPAVQDMVAGQIQAVSAPVGEFIQQVNAGKARFLGVSGAQRSRFAPNVPTFAEQGYKDLVFSEWFGFFAPGGTPAPVVQRANTALRTALEQKDVIDGLAVMGLEATSSTPDQLATLLKQSYDRWGPIVKEIGFTADS